MSPINKKNKVKSASAPKRRSQRIASQILFGSYGSRQPASSLNSFSLDSLDTGVNTDTNMNEANEKEKNWWLSEDSLSSLQVDEGRLPLVLERGVKFNQFANRVEKIKARRFFDYRNGTVTLIELPNGEHERAHGEFTKRFMSAFNNATAQDDVDNCGAKSLYSNIQTGEYEEPDACFTPVRLQDPLNQALNPCDKNGNPWPTIIFEVASSETLKHVTDKINNYWLAPNRCEDVIVIKIGNWKGKRRNNRTRRPLRRLRVSIIL
ncbi:hypothetical protein C1645_108299 [Glomus cerebriforme]|uniref:Putative restriction endonuclease domain-containing protein n=1 Tax=Glomus cerebriforme TaxID=658196 RepID=A0A397T486_9GLOM|nr:hypothetical protein C1645_108299 [Glomus cerebriforme]